mgnify:CR=1 FL=1
MTAKTYDPKCYDLAELFLEDEDNLNTEVRRIALAKTIQTAIEDFLTYERNNYEPPQHGAKLRHNLPSEGLMMPVSEHPLHGVIHRDL